MEVNEEVSLLDEPPLLQTLPTKVEDDRRLKQHIKDIFQLSCVHVKICMNLASGATTWCFSFHVLLTMLEVYDSAALAEN